MVVIARFFFKGLKFTFLKTDYTVEKKVISAFNTYLFLIGTSEIEFWESVSEMHLKPITRTTIFFIFFGRINNNKSYRKSSKSNKNKRKNTKFMNSLPLFRI